MVAAFSDVLEWIKGIPNVEESFQVTDWVKEKYRIENQLEGKVERLEKTLTNRDFQVKTLQQELQQVRSRANKMDEALREMEEKEKLSDDKMSILEQANKHFQKIIQKLLKEKRALTKEKDTVSETPMGTSAVVELGRGLDEITQRLQASEKRVREVTEVLEKTKESRTLTANEMDDILMEVGLITAPMERTLSSQRSSGWSSSMSFQRSSHLKKEYEEKLQKERDDHKAALEKLMESKDKISRWSDGVVMEKKRLEMKHFELVKEIKKERAERDNTIKLIESALQAAEAHLIERMTRICCLEQKCKTLTETVEIKDTEIERLTASERLMCAEKMVSQDKLVAQMEMTIELQKEVKKMTERIQNLGIEEISSDEDEGKEENVEVAAEALEEEAYSSDSSSFDPVDDDDLYN